LIESNIIPQLKDFDHKYPYATSLIVIASHLTIQLVQSSDNASQSICLSLFVHIFPWTQHFLHAVRVSAQTLIFKILNLNSSFIKQVPKGTLLQHTNAFLTLNNTMKRVRETQIDDTVLPLNTVESIYLNNPDLDHEESLLEKVKIALKNIRKQFLNAADSEAYEDTEIEKEEMEDTETSLQKRIIPWETAFQGLDRPSYGLMMADRESERQPMIVVAGLLDNLPNIAGLVRTAEIFNMMSLAIPNKSVMKTPAFKKMTVSAEKHLPIIEVKPNQLSTYLAEKKSDGFTIVAVEQTTTSIQLQDFEFPEKVVLLLGSEQEGIPSNYLTSGLVDRCIEIPQLGTIRSLNVHVCASIVMWQFTKQRLKK